MDLLLRCDVDSMKYLIVHGQCLLCTVDRTSITVVLLYLVTKRLLINLDFRPPRVALSP